MARINAVLIGINEYQDHPGKKLMGCLHDVEQMECFLHQQKQHEISLIRLTDETATKGKIAEVVRTHLGKSEPGDIALLYYSGHGAQEAAGLWGKFSKDLLQGLVCHDSLADGGSILSDKELRWLLFPICEKQVHVLTIFDCCHAFGNTRDNYRVRFIPGLPEREWKAFLFAEEIEPRDLEAAMSISSLLPEASYIHMAASESDQPAYEVEGKGVFTQALLDVLERSGGKVTYRELDQRIRISISGQFNQRPAITAVGPAKGLKDEVFLGGLQDKDAFILPVQWSGKEEGWKLAGGVLHGLESHGKAVEVEILRKNEKLTDPVCTAHIGEVLLDTSQIHLDPSCELDPNGTYEARCPASYHKPLYIRVEGVEKGRIPAFEHFEARRKDLEAFNIREAAEKLPDYVLKALQIHDSERYCLTFPTGDTGAAYPLSAYAQPYNEQSLDHMIDDLKKMQRWNYFRRLGEKSKEQREQASIRLVVFDEYEEELQAENGVFNLEADSFSGEKKCKRLKFKIINSSKQRYYFELIHLRLLFGIYRLPTGVGQLVAGDEAWLFGGQVIPVEFEDFHQRFPQRFSSDFYFQVVASTKPFSLPEEIDFYQDVMEPGEIKDYGPKRGETTLYQEEEIPRFCMIGEEVARSLDRWEITNWTFRQHNPWSSSDD